MKIIIIILLIPLLSGCYTFQARGYETMRFIDGEIRPVKIMESQGIGGRASFSDGSSIEQDPLFRIPDFTVLPIDTGEIVDEE